MLADAGETVSRQSDFALAEQVRSRNDGEHCSMFRCGGQRNELRSRADARLMCGRAIALSRQDSPSNTHRIMDDTERAHASSAAPIPARASCYPTIGDRFERIAAEAC